MKDQVNRSTTEFNDKAKATITPKTETPLEAIDLVEILASSRERMEKLLGRKRMEEIEEAKKRKKEKIFERIRSKHNKPK